MSGLTKKQIYVDQNLATVLGMAEGELVSYADIQKRLHKYIKDNDLKSPQRKVQQAMVAPPQAVQMPAERLGPSMKKCRDCGAEIPAEAIFCDLCGVSQ